MHTTNLRKVGGSIMLAIPPALFDVGWKLRPGSKIGLAVRSGRLVVEPQQRPRYTLDELLAKGAPKGRRDAKDFDWVRGKRAGRELI